MSKKPIRKIENGNKKYLWVLGIKIPYTTQGEEEKRTATIAGFLKLTYYRSSETESLYIKIFGKPVVLKEGRRIKHYKMREQLDTATKKKILVDEVSGDVGYRLNLDNPQSYNEKINWLKLYNKDPRITTCCDKYAVKDYITEKLGDGYVVPTIAVWDDPEQIDFDALPDKFVLKVNWSSGFNIIVKDKSTINRQQIVKKLKRWMQPHSNSYYSYFNWGYKDMKPVCYAEEYMEQFDGQLYDYKFLFSNGKLVYLLIVADRLADGEIVKTFHDEEFNVIPMSSGSAKYCTVPMPKRLEKMVEKAKCLADDFPLVRIDFYEVEDKIMIGEMTFYCGGGRLAVTPVEWDYKIGEKIDISNVDIKE